MVRPILKQKEYNINIAEAPNKIEADYFKSTLTTSQIKKREEHIKKTLEWANKDMLNQTVNQDIEMEDVTGEDCSDNTAG